MKVEEKSRFLWSVPQKARPCGQNDKLEVGRELGVRRLAAAFTVEAAPPGEHLGRSSIRCKGGSPSMLRVNKLPLSKRRGFSRREVRER